MTTPSEPVAHLRSTRAFPSTIEIIGVIAAVLPFLVTTADTSSRTVNGQVVDFHYRDWPAVAGGSVAAIIGIVALLFVARTDSPRRVARAVLAIALLAAGTYSVLRGFGALGVAVPRG